MIQEILEKSGVNNIRVLGDDESSSKESASSSSESSPSSEVPFDFIGRKAAVENAVLMLEYHLDHLKVSWRREGGRGGRGGEREGVEYHLDHLKVSWNI